MRFAPSLLAILGTLATAVSALTPAQWRSQSIYQVLTDRFARTDLSTNATCDALLGLYCGGTFDGLISKLDYIQNMGFTAIWISPVVENLSGNSEDGESYHGYWAQDIYSINSHFGSASDLVKLSSALHKRGMYLMVDIVTNHMGYRGCRTCVDYSVFNPFNKQSYYHAPCPIDYSNLTSVQTCWEGDNTVSLPDLRTEDSDVLSSFKSWITTLVKNYTIDGLRLDSAYEVDTAFFTPFESASGVYLIGEVDDNDPKVVCPYQKYMSGVLNYPTWEKVTDAFKSTGGDMEALAGRVTEMKSTCEDTTLLGSFLENHDQKRFPYYTEDVTLAKNAIAFTVLQDGIPIVYEGQEQHYSGGATPRNREAIWLSGYNTSSELYSWIASLNAIRNQAIFVDGSYVTYKADVIHSDAATIALRKGDKGEQIVSVFSNKGEGAASYNISLSGGDTGFVAGEKLVEVMGCTAYSADGSGNLEVEIKGGVASVFYPRGKLEGSQICASLTG